LAHRRAFLATVLAVALAACGGESYPLPSGPPGATLRSPAAVGRPTRAVLIYLEVRPGDEVELIGAEALGSIEGASVRFLVSYPVIDPDGDYVIGDEFEPLEGAIAAATSPMRDPRNTVGIAAELTAAQPGRFEIDNVRLRYRLNGRPERVGEGIDVVWTVCVDDPAPADCPEE
jgi:hypothetical protein